MKRILLCSFLSVLLAALAGCAPPPRPAVQRTNAPDVDVIAYPGGFKSVYEYSDGSFTVYFPNKKVMFRASGWNGREVEPVITWLPLRGIEARKHFWYLREYGWVFDYGLPEGKTIKWGSYNLYEGWYESGAKMYRYDFPRRSYTEWGGDGKVIEQVEGLP
jgi:hypothetical protein